GARARGTEAATMASAAARTHETAAASHSPMASLGERLAQGRPSAVGPRQPAAAAYAVSRTAPVSGLIPIMAGWSWSAAGTLPRRRLPPPPAGLDEKHQQRDPVASCIQCL